MVSETGDPSLSRSELEAWGIGGAVAITLYVVISLICVVLVYKGNIHVWGLKDASAIARFGVAFGCIFFFPFALVALIVGAIVEEKKKTSGVRQPGPGERPGGPRYVVSDPSQL